MKTTKRRKVNTEIDKELAKVDKLFRELGKDKSLPTFGEHFMYCLMFDIAERVNLKKMYPGTYTKLSKWLAQHNASIQKARG